MFASNRNEKIIKACEGLGIINSLSAAFCLLEIFSLEMSNNSLALGFRV